MIHHVSPGGHFHASHIGSCDDSRFPLIDHSWATLPEVKPGRCGWCLASDDHWRDLLARADTVRP